MQTGAREALIEALYLCVALGDDDSRLEEHEWQDFTLRLAELRKTLAAYRNVGVNLFELGVERSLIERYLGELADLG
jgi:hypothetical protein